MCVYVCEGVSDGIYNGLNIYTQSASSPTHHTTTTTITTTNHSTNPTRAARTSTTRCTATSCPTGTTPWGCTLRTSRTLSTPGRPWTRRRPVGPPGGWVGVGGCLCVCVCVFVGVGYVCVVLELRSRPHVSPLTPHPSPLPPLSLLHTHPYFIHPPTYSTYLVQKRLDMLPKLLTETLCSLTDKDDHFAFRCSPC